MAAELVRHLRGGLDAEQVFVERRRKCRQIAWRERPDHVIEHWTKHLAFLQINACLPRYDIYHFLSERHARLLKYGRKPAVVTIHDAAPLRTDGVYTEGTRRRFRQNMETLLKAQAIVANTHNAKRDLVELFGVPQERVEVVYPGVNHEVYAPRDRTEVRELLGLPASAKIILNVGNENKNNNIPALVEVLAKVRERCPDVLLLRVGPTNPQVDEVLERFSLNGAVVRPGADEGLTTLYNYYFNAADLYLCLDHYTGYSIQGLCAFASGCPVVSSWRGGFSEIAAGAAKLIDHTDMEEVVQAVLELLEDAGARRELAERALEHSRKFTWEKTASSYLKVYQKALNGANGWL
jgi:glycosyltransferase involved in cell wall biosynthesis